MPHVRERQPLPEEPTNPEGIALGDVPAADDPAASPGGASGDDATTTAPTTAGETGTGSTGDAGTTGRTGIADIQGDPARAPGRVDAGEAVTGTRAVPGGESPAGGIPGDDGSLEGGSTIS